MNLKFVFFGTPDYVIPILESLSHEFKGPRNENPFVAVVTQSPKPTGRKQILEYTPVDRWAHKKQIPIYFDSSKLVEEGITADLGIVASYGSIIPAEVLRLFPNGLLNIHPSLLPKYRGASPVQATLAAGDPSAYVSIMKIDELMDHGPILSTFKEEVFPTDTTESLRERLFTRSAEVLPGLVQAYIEGKVKLKEQDHGAAIYTRLVKKDHGFIDWKILKKLMNGKKVKEKLLIPFIKNTEIEINPQSIERYFRSLYPWPGLWTMIPIKNQEDRHSLEEGNPINNKEFKRLKILDLSIEGDPSIPNSQILTPKLVQLEGKKEISWKQFCEAYKT